MHVPLTEFIVDWSKAPFVDRRVGGVDHATLTMKRRPLRWPIFVLQTVHLSHDHLLPLAVFLHKHNTVKAVLMFGGKHLCVIDAVELLHLAVRGAEHDPRFS
jgi:hypothetical protein